MYIYNLFLGGDGDGPRLVDGLRLPVLGDLRYAYHKRGSRSYHWRPYGRRLSLVTAFLEGHPLNNLNQLFRLFAKILFFFLI